MEHPGGASPGLGKGCGTLRKHPEPFSGACGAAIAPVPAVGLVAGTASPYLTVLAEVGPHAGAIAAAHEDVVGEEVGAGDGAGELAGGGVVAVAQVGDHVVELEDLVALVGVLEAGVEGDARHRAIGSRAHRTRSPRSR